MTDVELGEAWLVSALRPIGLAENSSGGDDLSRRPEHTGTLEVLPAGSALQDPDELGFDSAMGQIIQRVRGRADVVLLDAPPALKSNAIALSAHVDALVVVVRLKALRASALQELGWMLDASPAMKLGFVVTGADKVEGYGQRQRYIASEQRLEPRPRPVGVPASAADGDGEATAEPRSKSAGRPFGGLSPREAAQKSAQSRRAKSANREEAAQRAALDEPQNAVEDA